MSEEPLHGGNTTVVVRVGDTVRRPVGPWTPAVHGLLDHLAAVGFTGSPRVLGIDESNREILEFVPGEVGSLSAAQPLPAWFATPDACWSIGRWIRDFQSAQADLVVDRARPWRRAPGASLGSGQVIVHHDVSPYNTVRRPDGSLVVLDWDFARPGNPIEDLAWAAWRWVPLMAGREWHAEYGVGDAEDVRDRQRRHLAALLDGYGPVGAPAARPRLGDHEPDARARLRSRGAGADRSGVHPPGATGLRPSSTPRRRVVGRRGLLSARAPLTTGRLLRPVRARRPQPRRVRSPPRSVRRCPGGRRGSGTTQPRPPCPGRRRSP